MKVNKHATLIVSLCFLLMLAACSGPVQPKAGHWIGSQPDVSFDVTADGNLANFTMTVPYGASDCTIYFESATLPEKGVLALDLTSTETLSKGAVTGDFSAEKISGKYNIKMCNMSISMKPADGEDQSWSAEWKSP